MGVHDDCLKVIWDGLERTLDRFDELRRFVQVARTVAGDPQLAWKKATIEARASLIVCSMAEMEALTRLSLAEVHRSLNALLLPSNSYRLSLLPLLGDSRFESLRMLNNREKMWDRRSELMSLHSSVDVVEFPVPIKGPQPPMDGATLRPVHFQRIWSIYGLAGVPFPEQAWSLSLGDMADLRNDVAHANSPFGAIFQAGGRSVEHLLQHLINLEEFAMHLVESWDCYLTGACYIR